MITNTNLLHPNKFALSFARLPHVQYFCQKVIFPGMFLGEALHTTPFIDRFAPGDKLIYDYLQISFMVDEDMKNWNELYEWIRGISYSESFQEYRNLGKLLPVNPSNISKTPQYSDASLTIYDSKETPKLRYNFLDCFPTTISAIPFDTTTGPATVITCDATFRFLIFNLDK